MQADTVEDLFRRFGPNFRWYVTFAGLIGGFSMVLSATIVNVAVPEVMGAFGVGQDQAQWMATAFFALGIVFVLAMLPALNLARLPRRE